MRFSVDKLSFVGRLRKSQKPFSVPFSFEPLALIKHRTLFDAHTSDLVLDPGSLIDPSIDIVVNPLSTFFSPFHLSLVPLSIFFDVYTLSMVEIVVPLTEINIAVGILEYTCSCFFMIFELSLVDLSGGILDLSDIFHELAAGVVDILFEEGFDDAGFFVEQLVLYISSHNDKKYINQRI